MTALGGIGHTLPFLLPEFHVAMTAAIIVVLLELAAITWIRHHYMDTPPLSAALQVGLGGALVFVTGVLIGKRVESVDMYARAACALFCFVLAAASRQLLQNAAASWKDPTSSTARYSVRDRGSSP